MSQTPVADLLSWETVVHTVERDVVRAETLLIAAGEADGPKEERVAAAARLWLDGVAQPVLPPLHSMPAVPAELLERVQSLRVRITHVRTELETAMRANRVLLADTVVVRPVAESDSPRFIDTLA